MTQSIDINETFVPGTIRDAVTGVPLVVNADGSINATIVGGGAAASALFPQVASVNIPSASILTLFTTPVTIVAAPGAGKMIQVLSVNYSLTFVTTAYTVGGATVSLTYNAGASPVIDNQAKSVLNAVASKMATVNATANTGTAPANVANLPVTLSTVTSNPTTGDGTFRVTVTYITVTL